MKKTYQKPVLVRREVMSRVTASVGIPWISSQAPTKGDSRHPRL